MAITKYPVGIQTFSEIRVNGYLYVDKTEYIYNLVTQGKYYFLSRPRRFGKSLLLSTIEALFLGKRDLFDGLYIADKDWEWGEYPVFHLALNGQNYDAVGRLFEILHNYMAEWEKTYGLPCGDPGMSPSLRLSNIIRNACEKTGRQAVILIDEYDQPLLQNIEEGKEDLQDKMRNELQAFYSIIKSHDQYIRFGMLTGVSKFSKVSVFSGLNNLNDISLNVDANAICGISESELNRYFSEGISVLAKSTELTIGQTKERLKKEFDGYHFSESGEGVYNPFSLLNTFDSKRFRHCWFESGTPKFLTILLKNRDWNLSEIAGSICLEQELRGSDMYLTNPIPLLYQSGYLTIREYDSRFGEYTLDYPNEEVSEGFTGSLLKTYSDKEQSLTLIKKFVRSMENGEPESFMRILQSLLADIPNDRILNRELHYENMMYLVMKLMGYHVHTEYRTSDGRIDMVVETDRFIYVLEFKLHGTPEEAMAQIQAKEYATAFRRKRQKNHSYSRRFLPQDTPARFLVNSTAVNTQRRWSEYAFTK